MLAKLLTVFRIPELRQKIFLTLILLFVYRMGFFIPLPIVDQEVLQRNFEEMKKQSSGLGQALKMVELFSASSFGNSTIFGLGIMPYISASIIIQLLATVYPPLEALQKEGESGRKRLNEYTRYATVFLSFFQHMFWMSSLSQMGTGGLLLSNYNGVFPILVCAIVMTTGTLLLMWIGEQIDEYGIGNGVSLLIMAGILARAPRAFQDLLEPTFKSIAPGTERGIDKLAILTVLFIAVILAVIAITQGQRRIPTQSARHMRGRRAFGGGQRHSLPLKVNQSGVMPIIFASTLLMVPGMLFNFLGSTFEWQFARSLASAFSTERGFLYSVSFIALIYFFCYFWTAITFSPKDIANNLRDYGSFIPGQRPGKRTEEYLERVMVRITYVGAAFLAIVAVIPSLVNQFLNLDYIVASFFGGTGLLIVVSVGLDLVQKIDSHLVMRSYTGLLEK